MREKSSKKRVRSYKVINNNLKLERGVSEDLFSYEEPLSSLKELSLFFEDFSNSVMYSAKKAICNF